ncbi:MAG: PP2C family protein-serine/threonine phosphatase [Candidatus Acidiferrales bacterium]
MSTTPQPVQKATRGARRRLREYWARVTEGQQMDQLWAQFKSEAQASYGLYSQDVDWDAIKREEKKWKRPFLAAWALFQAMLMKLSPARRVLLLIAAVLIIVEPDIRGKSGEVMIDLEWVGVLILFLLLALELADRVTMKRDLEIAREIQQWLVPNSAPLVSGMDIAFATRPQNTVAGDYYDAFYRAPAAEGSAAPPLVVVVADVAGKSVPAALVMATFQASLRALSATPATLAEIITGIDRYTRAHSLEGRRFTTAFLAEITPDTREMRYVNAGHNDPILRRASGGIERLSTGGPPFGLPLFTENEISYQLGRVQLQPGDLLFIFTDGVVEAVNQAGQEYGEARLLACLLGAPPEPAAETLKRVMADVNQFVGAVRQHDDITCLVLRVNA